MTNAEAKNALFEKTPVVHNNIRYRRIYEICYRMPEDKLVISLGLLDAHTSSIVYAAPEKVEAIPKEGRESE